MKERDFAAIYQRFSACTMMPADRYVANLKLAHELKKSSSFPLGAVVECGVWRGGSSAGWMEIFGARREYFLFDSFIGLPHPSERDGDDARWWAAHPEHERYFDNNRADRSYVDAIATQNRDRGFQVTIVEGWYEHTLSNTILPEIAFLHLDCDWYDSVSACLKAMWHSVKPGGAIVIDDYFDWEGCRRAVHNFLSENHAREAIERVGRSGGALIRRRGNWDISESPHLM